MHYLNTLLVLYNKEYIEVKKQTVVAHLTKYTIIR